MLHHIPQPAQLKPTFVLHKALIDMSFMKSTALIGLIASIAHVAAHGRVSGIVADGVYYEGYSAGFQYSPKPPTVVGWSIPKDINTGFIAPDAYGSPDIICHLDATPGGASASVKAGGTVELQWTPWPTGHHGPVIDYLANCNGNCSSVDKTTLKFNKIDEMGLIDDNVFAGNWASDKMITTNNTWSVTIPPTTAPGNYVLRHEIIALHSAQNVNGAQNYPQCVNLKVTGAGTDSLASGTLGEALYKATDAGIAFNIYTKLPSYPIPGPTLYKDAVATPKGNTTSVTVPQSTFVSGSQSTSVVVPSSSSIVVSQSTYVDVPESTSAAVSGSSGSAAETVTYTTAAAVTSTTEAYVTGTSTPTTSDAYVSPISITTSIAKSIVVDLSSSSASAVDAVISTAAVSTTDAAVTTAAEGSNTMTTVPDVTYESSTPAASATPSISPASVAAPTVTVAVTTPAGPIAEPSTGPTGSTKSVKPLPPGTTLEQLLEWLEIMLLSMFKDGERKVHARAF